MSEEEQENVRPFARYLPALREYGAQIKQQTTDRVQEEFFHNPTFVRNHLDDIEVIDPIRFIQESILREIEKSIDSKLEDMLKQSMTAGLPKNSEALSGLYHQAFLLSHSLKEKKHETQEIFNILIGLSNLKEKRKTDKYDNVIEEMNEEISKDINVVWKRYIGAYFYCGFEVNNKQEADWLKQCRDRLVGMLIAEGHEDQIEPMLNFVHRTAESVIDTTLASYREVGVGKGPGG